MPDRRRSLAGAIAVSFSLSATLLFPVMAHAVSDDVAVQLLQRLDQLEGEVRDLRGENEVLRDRLGNLPKPAGDDPARDAENAATPRLNLSLPEVDKPELDQSAATATATATATAAATDKPKAETPSASVSSTPPAPAPVTATSRADGAEQASAAAEKKDTQDATDKLVAELKKEPEQSHSPRVSPTSSDSYFTYGEQGKKALEKAAVRPLPKPEATVTIARVASNDGNGDKASPETTTRKNVEKPTVTKAVDSTEKKARMAYNDAYKLVRQSPADAVTSFRNFLNNYPKHRLASNAQYWLGEALYTQKDYSSASVEFMKVLKQHKDSDKAPGAALKLGFSFYELKQWALARRTLEDTKRFFPNNSVAQLAQSRLTKMDAEGH